MAKSRSFGTEKTRGSAGDRKGPAGEMILDAYEDVERGFKALEAELDAVSLSNMPAAASGDVDLGQQDVIGAKTITSHASSHLTLNAQQQLKIQKGGVDKIHINATGLGFYGTSPAAQPSDLSGTNFTAPPSGTPSATNTLADMSAQSDVDNNFATLARAINEIRDALRALGLMQ